MHRHPTVALDVDAGGLAVAALQRVLDVLVRPGHFTMSRWRTFASWVMSATNLSAALDDFIDAGCQQQVRQLASQPPDFGGIAPEVDDVDRLLKLVDHVGCELLDPLGMGPGHTLPAEYGLSDQVVERGRLGADSLDLILAAGPRPHCGAGTAPGTTGPSCPCTAGSVPPASR